MMKGKDLKWLVGMIPDDALVTIDNNPNVEIVAVDCDGIADRVHNLVLTDGWSIANDAELDTMVLRLRQLIEGYRSQDQDLNEAAEELANEHGFVKHPSCKPAKYSYQAVRDVFIEAAVAGAKWMAGAQQQQPLVWKRIKQGEKLPCRAYLYKLAYEQERNFGGIATVDGYLVPNDPVRVGCDTWYLSADAVKNLPKEGQQ